MCQDSAANATEETAGERADEHVQRYALTSSELLLGERRNVKVRNDVAEEVAEGAQSKEEEQFVLDGRSIE